MAHAIRRVVRGPSTKVNAYAGPAGELVMDTTTNDLVLETGMAGGVRMAKASTAISATNGVEVTVGGTLGEATTISGVDATTSVKGVVQLSGATNGTSQTKAATEKAVADALQAAKDYTDTHGGSGGKTYTGTAPIVVNNTSDTISINDATSSAKGVVQLSNSTTGTSQTVAATEKAVADALTAAKSYADTHGKTYTGSSPVSVSGTTISVASASTSAAGVVQLNNSTSSTSQTQAATPKAVSDALSAAKTYVDNITAHLAMPNHSRTVALVVPSSGGTVTAPGDGYIGFHCVASSSASASMWLACGKLGDYAQNSGGKDFWMCLPVSKNDVVTVSYGVSAGTLATKEIYFTYANGAA